MPVVKALKCSMQRPQNCSVAFWLRGRISPGKRIRRYIKPDVSNLEDFGLSAFTSVQAEDIYELIGERHLKSSS